MTYGELVADGPARLASSEWKERINETKNTHTIPDAMMALAGYGAHAREQANCRRSLYKRALEQADPVRYLLCTVGIH